MTFHVRNVIQQVIKQKSSKDSKVVFKLLTLSRRSSPVKNVNIDNNEALQSLGKYRMGKKNIFPPPSGAKGQV